MRSRGRSRSFVPALQDHSHLPCSCSLHIDSRISGAGGTGRRAHNHSNRALDTKWSPHEPQHVHNPCKGGTREGWL